MRRWENKRSDLNTVQKREAKAILWGVFGERKCFLCGGALTAHELMVSYTVHHILQMGMPGCNFMVNLHLAHLTCNSKHGKPRKAIQTERERKIARAYADTMTPNRTHEEIVHTEALPLVERYVIRKIQEGWIALRALRKQAAEDMVLENADALRKAVSCLKYGVLCAAAANEHKVAIQTVYHWMFVWKNQINGFVYPGDFPEGKLLDFVDPEDHGREVEDIYQRLEG